MHLWQKTKSISRVQRVSDNFRTAFALAFGRNDLRGIINNETIKPAIWRIQDKGIKSAYL